MIDTLMTLMALIPLDIPNVTPEEPPGMGGLTTILGWIAWGVTILCVVGFLVGVGMLVVAQHNGERQGAQKIVVALIAVVLIGSCSALFGVFSG